MLYLLVGVLTVMFFASCILNKDKDVGAPSIVLCASMLLSSFFATIGNLLYWKTDIEINTVFLISISMLFIIIGDVCASLLCTKRTVSCAYSGKIICVEKVKVYIVILCGIVTILLQYKNVVANTGRGSISDILYSYRIAYNRGELITGQTGLLSNFVLLITVFAYIFLYIFIHNFIVGKRKEWILLVPVMLLCISGLLDGARGKLVDLLLAGILYIYYIYQDRCGWKQKSNKKIIFKIIGIAVIAGIVFVQLGEVIGRGKAAVSVLYQICLYIAGDNFLLDRYINTTNMTQKLLWGQRTFSSFYNFILAHFSVNLPQVPSYISMGSNGYSFGNVYSAIAPWYGDFGYVGVGILSFIFGFLFSMIYRRIGRIKKQFSFIYWTILYGYLINCQFLFLFNDRFYARLNPSFIKLFLLFWVALWYILQVRISKGKIYIKSR